jgi:type I restriction enzyme S subunit
MKPDFNSYPVYKDSNEQWIGRVPDHWSVVPNRAIFREIIDQNHLDCPLLSVTISRGIIRQSDLISNSSKKDSSNLDKSKYKLVQPGDIAYNKMRAWQGAIGVSDYRGIVSPAYIVVRLRENHNPKYFHYLFRTPAFAKEAERWSYGITSDQWSLRPEHFKMIYCPLPSIEEQDAIVKYLDYMDLRIKRYIRVKKKLIKLLDEEKQAIIHQAVTRGLDPKVRFIPSGVEWLGNVPEHWDIERLKNHVINITEQTNRKKNNEIYIALENVESWTGKLVNLDSTITFESQVKRFKPTDLLFGKLRPYLAKVTDPKVKGVCVGEFFVLRPRNKRLNISFLKFLLTSKPIIDVIDSSTFGAKMPRTSWAFFGSILLSFPPLLEQEKITKYLEEKTERIMNVINNIKLEISFLQEYRTRLIADVVTGKLDVRSASTQLPDDFEELELIEEETEFDEDLDDRFEEDFVSEEEEG